MRSPRTKSLVDRFPAALREARTEKGISQEELAARAGLHRTYISQVERGLKSPSLRSLSQIATALEMPLWALIKRMDA